MFAFAAGQVAGFGCTTGRQDWGIFFETAQFKLILFYDLRSELSSVQLVKVRQNPAWWPAIENEVSLSLACFCWV